MSNTTHASEKITLPLSGMSCGGCAGSVQRALEKHPGVTAASVSLALNNATVLSDPKVNDRLRLFWFATGKDDFVLPSTKAALAMLDQNKIRYSYKETEGGHTWPNWRAYLNEFAPLLFR